MRRLYNALKLTVAVSVLTAIAMVPVHLYCHVPYVKVWYVPINTPPDRLAQIVYSHHREAIVAIIRPQR